jgi:hypothetical protein
VPLQSIIFLPRGNCGAGVVEAEFAVGRDVEGCVEWAFEREKLRQEINGIFVIGFDEKGMIDAPRQGIGIGGG